MSLLIKYATRGRAEWFKRAVINIINTIGTNDFKIIVSADEDDVTMNNPNIHQFVWDNRECMVGIFYGPHVSKIHAINRDMEQADDDWTWLINMSDDMTFTKYMWDVTMQQRIKSVWGDSTDYFAHFSDGYVHDKLPTMSIMGREYYERDNYIYHPDYKSFSCDAEAMFVAMKRGRHHYFPDVLFLHQHPTQTPKPQDETYRVNSLATPHDLKVYWGRLNSNFGLGENIGPCPWDEWKGKQPNNF